MKYLVLVLTLLATAACQNSHINKHQLSEDQKRTFANLLTEMGQTQLSAVRAHKADLPSFLSDEAIDSNNFSGVLSSSVCQIDIQYIDPAKQVFDYKMQVTSLESQACPVETDLSFVWENKSQTQFDGEIQWDYVAKNEEMSHISDIAKINLHGPVQLNLSISHPKTFMDVKGQVLSRKHGVVDLYLRGTLMSDQGQITLTARFPRFVAHLTVRKIGTASEYDLNGEKMSQGAFWSYFYKAMPSLLELPFFT